MMRGFAIDMLHADMPQHNTGHTLNGVNIYSNMYP